MTHLHLHIYKKCVIRYLFTDLKRDVIKTLIKQNHMDNHGFSTRLQVISHSDSQYVRVVTVVQATGLPNYYRKLSNYQYQDSVKHYFF